jgi:purine-binding chemotaxis protein CheW
MRRSCVPQDDRTGPSATPWDDNGQLEVLTFDVGDERLAVEAVNIREILDLLPETPVPGAPDLVASVVNFRGKIIPIADLRVAFGMPREGGEEANTDHRIVVVETEIGGEPLQIGLRSDKVHEVTILDRADASEPPVLGMRWRREFVRELVRQPGSVIVIPDLPTIFTSLAEAA